MNWFLYDRDLCHESVKVNYSLIQYYAFKGKDLCSLLFSYFKLLLYHMCLEFFKLKVLNVKTKQNKLGFNLRGTFCNVQKSEHG